ncbi:MAG: DNA polymerase IV [Balneolaceae bacterium]|nr:DNA polymerase IV [Balneolaceae bacterium]
MNSASQLPATSRSRSGGQPRDPLPELPSPGRYQLDKNVHNITRYQTIAADMQHVSSEPRLYVHVDMNAFYAQVEQMCYNLYNMPVVVGGWRKEDGTVKGIVATSSYEARDWGIKTGMSALEAYKLCPYVVFKQVDYEKYRAYSKRIKAVLDRFSPDVEAYSLDEYFLDITWRRDESYEQLVKLGWDIKEAIREETNLYCSLGISTSKTYAKLASDLEKPNGLTVLNEESAIRERIWPLDLDEVWGIGRRRYAKLKLEGLYTIKDGIDRGYPVFQRIFGDYFGKILWMTVAGKDQAIVMDQTEYVPERVSYGHTFSTWTDDPWKVAAEFAKATKQVCYRLRGYGKKADKFFGNVRFQGPEKEGFSFTFRTPGFTNLDGYVMHSCLEKVLPILFHYRKKGRKFRAIMLGTTELEMTTQAELFFREDPELQRMYRAMDYLNNRFGLDTVTHGIARFDVKGNTHFKERSM